MPSERITFPGHDGTELAARLDLPEGPHLATALFAHCFTCSKDIPAARRIATRLAAMGIAVLRFDFTGLGHSEGEFANTDFSSNVADLLKAADYLAARGMAPSLLIGHSLGGAAAIRAANRIDSVRAVVTLGAPHDPEHITRHFAEALPEIEAKGVAPVELGGRRLEPLLRLLPPDLVPADPRRLVDEAAPLQGLGVHDLPDTPLLDEAVEVVPHPGVQEQVDDLPSPDPGLVDGVLAGPAAVQAASASVQSITTRGSSPLRLGYS